jgi:hypothetical protein
LLTHNIGLRADGHQAVDVFRDGYQDLAGHVAALLGASRLVLNVDAGSALLDEELGQLHDGRQAAVASVGVGDDRAQVVDVGELRALRLGRRQTLLALLAIVEKLGHEQVADLVGDGGLVLSGAASCSHIYMPLETHVGVVGKIWTRLVGRRGG